MLNMSLGTRNLGDIVYDVLRRGIILGYYPVGSRIIEEQVARDLGVSRTPVREALNKLEVIGLVSIESNKGAVVRGLSIQELKEIDSVRIILEAAAVELASQTITDSDIHRLEQILTKKASAESRGEQLDLNRNFHLEIFACAKNNFLLKTITSIIDLTDMLWEASDPDYERYREASKEHWGIIEALKQRDIELAKERIKDHILNTEAVVVRRMEETSRKRTQQLKSIIEAVSVEQGPKTR
jgi:DNA-binding GntR family transcriptional regulator